MSMNMVNMDGVDPVRSFFDSQKQHNKRQENHNRNVEWMMFAGLLQQEKLIQLQNSHLNQIKQENLEQQRNRRIDLYSSELMHRGFSPLEANTQAEIEIRFIELMEYTTNYVSTWQNKIDNARENIQSEKKVKFGIFSSRKYVTEIEISNAISKYRDNLEIEFKKTMNQIAFVLNDMNFTILYDDYDFRRKIQDVSGLIVKLPDKEYKDSDGVQVFSNEAVSQLFSEYTDINNRWKEINAGNDWIEASRYLPEKFLEAQKQLSEALNEVKFNFHNLQIISEEGGGSAEDASIYLSQISDSLNRWQLKSLDFVGDLEEYVESLGDSPVGKKLRKLILD